MKIFVKALSPFWSGNVNSKSNDYFRETGLLGSIRWWYEAILRGMGVYACDPSEKDKSCGEKEHCAACKLFGCTGWARKFNFRVYNVSINKDGFSPGNPIQGQIKEGYYYCLNFIETREIDPVERFLLTKTIELACKYGSFGAKNGLKPIENIKHNPEHHKNYGLFEFKKCDQDFKTINQSAINDYLKNNDKLKTSNKCDHPAIENFWFANSTVNQSDYNNSMLFNSGHLKKMVNGKEKSFPWYLSNNNDLDMVNQEPYKWIRGFEFKYANSTDKQKCSIYNNNWESKKLFSFYGDRSWGYARKCTYDIDVNDKDDVKTEIELERDIIIDNILIAPPLNIPTKNIKIGEQVFEEIFSFKLKSKGGQ